MDDNTIDQIAEQIQSLTKRYNALAEMSEKQRGETIQRNSSISTMKDEIYAEIEFLKRTIQELDTLITSLKTDMKNTSSKFKEVVKQDQFDKLNRRINDLKYEEFITLDEMEKYD